MKGKVKGRLNRIFIILMCAMLAVCPVMTETVSAANTSKSNTTAKKNCQDGLRYSVDRSDTIEPERIIKAVRE